MQDKWRLGSKKPIRLELSDSLKDEENLLRFESNNFEQFIKWLWIFRIYKQPCPKNWLNTSWYRRLVIWYFLMARHSTLVFGDFLSNLPHFVMVVVVFFEIIFHHYLVLLKIINYTMSLLVKILSHFPFCPFVLAFCMPGHGNFDLLFWFCSRRLPSPPKVNAVIFSHVKY